MNSSFIVANWKSNKTLFEAEEWIKKFNANGENIVICVPFTLLSAFNQPPLNLGAQDVSMFDQGAYTGEVSAVQIKEFADWVIIGHSERRNYFNETDDMLQKKVEQAKKVGLKIIYCVPDATTFIPSGLDVVAYEPIWAIGTGESDTPENAETICGQIKQKSGTAQVIYGGSVTNENVASFVTQPHIDGVLVGSVSLEPRKFAALVANAQ